jgi:flagellar FliL protein
MSEEAEDAAAEEGQPKKGGMMKLILMVGLPVLLLLGGGAAAYLMGVIPLGDEANANVAAEEEVSEEADPAPTDIVFIDLPDLLLNLNVTGRRLRFLKVATALEVEGEEQAEVVRQFIPRILDNFHLYLRAVRPEELVGPEGVYRIKEELLVRINDTVRPAVVRDVLVKEMLVQ